LIPFDTKTALSTPITKSTAERHNGRSHLLGFDVDKMTLTECVGRLDKAIVADLPVHVVLVNAAKIVRARSDHELAHIIRTADMVGADGMPIVWASRLLSQSLPGRVNGTDLMYRLLELADQKRYRIFFLGSTSDLIVKAVDQVRILYPGVQVAGFRNGYFASAEEERAVVRKIAEANADILLVGISTPIKEKWVRRYIHELNVSVVHGVGGSFDILAGFVRRAPIWMQSIGLEWLYRLLQEPRRLWRRYLYTNTAYIVLVVRAVVQKFKR
jgi:N-acetylglucosaminyldiphosphoundecaprenol N-acetyl-beta-D-mannosaminyltransferase